MKTLFDCETEVAKCDCGRIRHRPFNCCESDNAAVRVHTIASLTPRGVLKIEQDCYLDNGGELPEQSRVPRQIIWEAAPETEVAIRGLAKSLHEQFVAEARKRLPPEFLV